MEDWAIDKNGSVAVPFQVYENKPYAESEPVEAPSGEARILIMIILVIWNTTNIWKRMRNMRETAIFLMHYHLILIFLLGE